MTAEISTWNPGKWTHNVLKNGFYPQSGSQGGEVVHICVQTLALLLMVGALCFGASGS